MTDWNNQIIEEFRANGGQVGGQFEGAPLLLLHHRGRKSGTEYIAPLMYLADADDGSTLYVFASKGGAPTHPEWYHNVTAAGTTEIEIGDDTEEVAVSEVTGDKRDEIFVEQRTRFPGFGDYEKAVEGVRTIPVIALHRP